ncbi:hypothetical protein M1D34_12170 [Ensifer sp. D2-11]
MAKRAKIGDVIQILTSEGVAYAQFTHKHEEYGHLLAVFEGFHKERPSEFKQIVDVEPQFYAFFPLQSALNQNLVSVVANTPVSIGNQPFPMFRTCHYTRDGAKVNWAVWDGEKSERLGRDLNEREKKYSLRGIISAPLLVERIEQGYRPETHDI